MLQQISMHISTLMTKGIYG